MKKSKTNPTDIDPQELKEDIDKILNIVNKIENTDFEELDFESLKKSAEAQTTYLKNKYNRT